MSQSTLNRSREASALDTELLRQLVETGVNHNANAVFLVSSAGRVARTPGRAPARDVDFIPNRHARPRVPMSHADAVDVVRRGGDVFANSRDTARRIAEEAGNGPPIWDPPMDLDKINIFIQRLVGSARPVTYGFNWEQC